MMELSPREMSWAKMVLFSMFPLRADEVTFGRDFELEPALAKFFSGLPTQAGLGLRAALVMVLFAPLFLLGKFALFPSVSATDRMKILELLMKHRIYGIRQLTVAWKAVGGLLVMGHSSLRIERERAHLKEPRVLEARA